MSSRLSAPRPLGPKTAMRGSNCSEAAMALYRDIEILSIYIEINL